MLTSKLLAAACSMAIMLSACAATAPSKIEVSTKSDAQDIACKRARQYLIFLQEWTRVDGAPGPYADAPEPKECMARNSMMKDGNVIGSVSLDKASPFAANKY